MPYYSVSNCKLRARLIEDTDRDAWLVTGWRNQESSRKAFFDKNVVTPDTHRNFMRSKAPHDLVFIAEMSGVPVGMFALKVNVSERTAEAGRFYIDESYRGIGLGKELYYLQLHIAFEFLRLDRIYGLVYTDNEAGKHTASSLGWVITDVTGSVSDMVYTKEMWKNRC